MKKVLDTILSNIKKQGNVKEADEVKEISDFSELTEMMTSTVFMDGERGESDKAGFTLLLHKESGKRAPRADNAAASDSAESKSSGKSGEGVFDPSVITDAYTIEREIGGEAMSRTFEIRSKKVGNPWFLKFVSSKDGSLANEEHILKLLNHPGLPKIVDLFYREEGTYLIESG